MACAHRAATRYPLDLVVCTALGVDMYDCVYPTRTGRFGTAMVPSGLLKLKQRPFAKDLSPVDKDCACFVCKTQVAWARTRACVGCSHTGLPRYTRAHLHHLLKSNSSAGPQLLTYHNIAYMMRLTRQMRDAIIANTYVPLGRGTVLLHLTDGCAVQVPRVCA